MSDHSMKGVMKAYFAAHPESEVLGCTIVDWGAETLGSRKYYAKMEDELCKSADVVGFRNADDQLVWKRRVKPDASRPKTSASKEPGKW